MLPFWTNVLLGNRWPSDLIRHAQTSGHLNAPELEALIGVQQDPVWHPEGTAYYHSLHCLDAFVKTRVGIEREDLIVGLAVVAHDFGKAVTTKLIDGKWTAHGHEAAGEEPTRAFLARIETPTDMVEEIVALVVNHMRPCFLYKDAKGKVVLNRSIRRLAREVCLTRLARVVDADKAGRFPLPADPSVGIWLRQCAALMTLLAAEPPPSPKVEGLLKGADLIAMGIPQGPKLGHILQLVAAQQLQGVVTTKEQAYDYVKAHLALNPL